MKPICGRSRLHAMQQQLSVVLECLCAGLLALACLTLTVEIFARAALGSALLWANELARYAVMWMVMLGSVVLAMRGGHIAITIASQRWPALQRLANLCAALLSAWFAETAWRFIELIRPFEQTTPTLALPTTWVYAVFPLAWALMALAFLLAACTPGRADA